MVGVSSAAPPFLPFTAVVAVVLGAGGRASLDIRRAAAEVGRMGRLRNSSFMSISFLIRLIISESLFSEARSRLWKRRMKSEPVAHKNN